MLACNEYDYIEIVCMHHYPIRLSMKKGGCIQGIALDTEISQSRDECIKINANGTEKLVVLDDIQKLEVLVENPHFADITFT